MNPKPLEDNNIDEICVDDIPRFILEFWKIIIVTGLLGVLASTIFLFTNPKKVEAVVVIRPAQVSFDGVQYANIETPEAMMAKFQLPLFYGEKVIADCGFSDGVSSIGFLKNIKLTLLKGTKLLELRVLAKSSEISLHCAQSIVKRFEEYQGDLSDKLILSARKRIESYKDGIQDARRILRSEKNGSLSALVYLSIDNDIRQLNKELIREYNLIESIEGHRAGVETPIFNGQAVGHNKTVIILFGLMAGFFVGGVLALTLRSFNRIKKNLFSAGKGNNFKE